MLDLVGLVCLFVNLIDLVSLMDLVGRGRGTRGVVGPVDLACLLGWYDLDGVSYV